MTFYFEGRSSKTDQRYVPETRTRHPSPVIPTILACNCCWIFPGCGRCMVFMLLFCGGMPFGIVLFACSILPNQVGVA